MRRFIPLAFQSYLNSTLSAQPHPFHTLLSPLTLIAYATMCGSNYSPAERMIEDTSALQGIQARFQCSDRAINSLKSHGTGRQHLRDGAGQRSIHRGGS